MGCVSVRPVKFSSSAGISLSSWTPGTLARAGLRVAEELRRLESEGKVSGSGGVERVGSWEKHSFNCEKT